MDTVQIELEIINSLIKWETIQSPLVVGIEGYSGAGKTTLLKQLSDKYSFIRAQYPGRQPVGCSESCIQFSVVMIR